MDRCESKNPNVTDMRCRLPQGHAGECQWWNKKGEKAVWPLTLPGVVVNG